MFQEVWEEGYALNELNWYFTASYTIHIRYIYICIASYTRNIYTLDICMYHTVCIFSYYNHYYIHCLI